jgi:hypothetical protein
MVEKIATRQRQENFADGIRSFLNSGQDFFSTLPGQGAPPHWTDPGPQDPKVFAEMREQWRAVGPSITAETIRRRPGTRPWAWWYFSQDILDVPIHFGDSGIRAALGAGWHGSAIDFQEPWLRRHGFLESDEERRLVEWHMAYKKGDVSDQPKRVDCRARFVVPD